MGKPWSLTTYCTPSQSHMQKGLAGKTHREKNYAPHEFVGNVMWCVMGCHTLALALHNVCNVTCVACDFHPYIIGFSKRKKNSLLAFLFDLVDRGYGFMDMYRMEWNGCSKQPKRKRFFLSWFVLDTAKTPKP